MRPVRFAEIRGIVFAVLLVAILIPVSSPAFATDPPKPLTATIASFSFPPILHTGVTGEFSGTMGETVKMLCQDAELTCDFMVTPLKRAYAQLRDGTVDALITINVNQLNDCCIPSDWSSPWTAGFFSSDGISAIPESREGLFGKALIVVNGMKSPYLFAKDLDKLHAERRLTLHKAPHILSSVKMFLVNRAPLLWGGEDFKWYIRKLDADARYDFKPFVKLPVVVWVRKDKPKILSLINEAFPRLRESKILGDKNLLNPTLMEQRYIDAPFVK